MSGYRIDLIDWDGRGVLAGHGLQAEGKPYKVDTDEDAGLVRHRYSSQGFALCKCGWRSEWLATDGARQRAHRQHKIDTRREQARA